MSGDVVEPDWLDGSWVTTACPPRLGCPVCHEMVPFGVLARVVEGQLQLLPEMTEIWAHSYIHEDS